ncbi:MAG: glycolate oxidase subunit GlcF [Pseudomonadota bacterium]
MQTDLPPDVLPKALASRADAALRQCVHCGFCNATCPTYQLTGNELDGPRGRIYLMKRALEGAEVSTLTQRHLDRCLTCTACETTCPSGVPYHALLGIGREYVDQRVKREHNLEFKRRLLRLVASRTWLFRSLLALGRHLAPLLPRSLRQHLPNATAPLTGTDITPLPQADAEPEASSVAVLRGCVHPVLAPSTETAARRVLARLGTQVVSTAGAGCCGALHHHFGDTQRARALARRNVAHFDRLLSERGVSAIVTTASGCGAFVRDYPDLLADPHTGDVPAAVTRVAAALRDVSEVIPPQALAQLPAQHDGRKVQLHCPCTLEHGLHASEQVRSLLRAAGIEAIDDPTPGHCCGSAGAYSVLEPEMATALGETRAASLSAEVPDVIATANVGCQQHLGRHTEATVMHWIELIEAATRPR